MSSNMRVFYLYIISLISLIMFISGIVAIVYNCTRYAFPTDYAFFENEGEIYTYTKSLDTHSYETRRQNYKREAVKDIIVSGLVIGIGYSLYNYHWKTIEKERNLLSN